MSRSQESEVRSRKKNGVAVLLMAAIGLIVGAIVVLLYMPIFDLAGGLT